MSQLERTRVLTFSSEPSASRLSRDGAVSDQPPAFPVMSGEGVSGGEVQFCFSVYYQADGITQAYRGTCKGSGGIYPEREVQQPAVPHALCSLQNRKGTPPLLDLGSQLPYHYHDTLRMGQNC